MCVCVCVCKKVKLVQIVQQTRNMINFFKTILHIKELQKNKLWFEVFLSNTNISFWRCSWCNGYRRRKWSRRHEFKNLDETDYISHSTNTLGKGMNPIILPPAIGK